MSNRPTLLEEWPLDPTSRTPLHVQFANCLLEKIETGLWKPGDRIPSERSLMQQANISRATVRQGLNALALAGAIERIHGRGTFVKQTKYEHTIYHAYSFYEQLSAEGVHLQDQVLTRELIDARGNIAARLQVETGSKLIHLKRLRSANNVPMMLSVHYFPYALCPDLVHDVFDSSLYQRLHDHYGLPVVRATDRFEARLPNTTTSRLLKISRRVPVLYVERLAFTTNDVILHLGQTYIRGDMYCFRTDLPARATSLMLKQEANTAGG